MTTVTWNIGDVIRKLRLARHWTQTNLATKAGLNKATVNRIEAGGRFQNDSLERIGVALVASVADLYQAVPRTQTETASRRPDGIDVREPPRRQLGLTAASKPSVLAFDRTVRSPALVVRAVVDPTTLVIDSIRVAQTALLTPKGDHRGRRIDEVLPPSFMPDVAQHVATARDGTMVTMLYSLRHRGVVVFRQAVFDPYDERVLITVSAIPPPEVFAGLTECCGEHADCADCARAKMQPDADGRAVNGE
jgi:transcriptional regulator with XRE-family HTH domain